MEDPNFKRYFEDNNYTPMYTDLAHLQIKYEFNRKYILKRQKKLK